MRDVTNPGSGRYRWVTRRSSRGSLYSVRERVPTVPRVTEQLRSVVVFVYRSKDDAEKNVAKGATGCLIGYPYKSGHYSHLYAVTNSHVIKRDGRTRALRLNRVDGGAHAIEIRPDEWTHHDDSDLAATHLRLNYPEYKLDSVSTELFLTEQMIDEGQFMEGDDCFFIGRHWGLDGLHRNTPTVRTGSVAIMRPEPIWRAEYVREEETIAIEARSLNGFSGSPIFVSQSNAINPPIWKDLLNEGRSSLIGKWPQVISNVGPERRLAFLGLTWGHMKGANAVVDPGSDDMSDDERALTLNSGIMLAVPAWRIRELLDDEELQADRDRIEAEHRERVAREEAERVYVADSDDDDDDEEDGPLSLHPVNPEDALRALLQTPPPHAD